MSGRQLPQCSAIEDQICTLLVSQIEEKSKNETIDIHDLSQSSWIWASLGLFLPLCVFGIFGNIITIIVFARFIKRTTTSIFIIALAIVDLVVCAVAMPIWVYTLLINDMTSDSICKLDGFLRFLPILMSACILLVIAFDRFLLIFLVKAFMTPLKAKIIIAILMAICTGIAVPNLLSVSTLQDIPTSNLCEGEITCNFKKCRPIDNYISRSAIFTLWQINAISFLVTVILFTIAYTLIFVKVYRMHKKMKGWKTSQQAPPKEEAYKPIEDDHLTFASADEANGLPTIMSGDENMNQSQNNSVILTSPKRASNSPTNENENLVKSSSPPLKKPVLSGKKKKKKLPHLHTAMTLSLVTLTFIVAYAPMIIMMFAGTCFKAKNDFSPTCHKNSFYYFIWHFYFLNHITNPIIYSFMNPRFKEALRSLFRGKKCGS